MSKNYNIDSTCQVVGLNEIYLKYFGYRANGCFIDVGAYDGIQHSNTWGLAEAGWSGICYEPAPEYYNLCRRNHANHFSVATIQTCIGNKIGEIPFYVAEAYSTYSDFQLNAKYRKSFYTGKIPIMVPITTADMSLSENKINPSFEVFSLDVEGAELDVLEGFDIHYWKPQMCIVEAHENHPEGDISLHADAINNYFQNANYKKIYCDQINNIYISKYLWGNNGN